MIMQLTALLNSNAGLKKFVDTMGKGADKVYQTVDKMSTAVMDSGIASVDNLTKGMQIADQYMDAYAKITLMNGGLEGAQELQDKIFASANRSNTAYEDMVSSVTQMSQAASDVFSNNDEVVAFTELAQKSFELGGLGNDEQNAGMDQLTQAMSGGSVGEDQLSSIMDSAPKIAEAIATYTGKSREELKRMAAEGVITSNTIKNAMFSMGDDINSDFKDMPKTFEDMWIKIQNSALEAFGPVIVKINEIFNSDLFQGFINLLIGGIGVVADIVLWVVEVIGWIGEKMMENWSIIQPILMAIGIVLLTLFVMTLFNLASIAVAWIAAFWPVFLIIGIIGLLIYWIVEFGESFQQVVGWIYGSVYVLFGALQNIATGIYNVFIWAINEIGKAMEEKINAFIDAINEAIALINELFGWELELFSDFKGWEFEYAEFVDLGGEWEYGNALGQADASVTVDSLKGMSDALTGLFNKSDSAPESGWQGPSFDGSSLALPEEMGVTNAGGQPLDVAIDQDDIKYIQDLAERDYIAKFGTATLAPNISVSFGDVHESMDINQVQGHVERILRDEIAMIGEG